MKLSVNISLAILIIQFLCGCRNNIKEENAIKTGKGCEYATNFDILGEGESKVIVIRESWNSGTNSGDTLKQSEYKKNPLKRVVCMSTSHIAYLSALGLQNCIVGVSGSKYISNPAIKDKINRGAIADVGFESSLNYELLISLKPDIVFSYGISGENNQYIEKMRQFGIRVVTIGDYLEEHPLGKLEYLKLFGELFGVRDKADSIYNDSKVSYLNYKNLAANTKRVNILINAPWKDVWYIPGERSYISVLINDAGGNILLSKKGKTTPHSYNLEEVYSHSYDADYWLNPNNYSSIEELKYSNPLFKNIPALKEGLIFNNILRNTPEGGSDFWETGVVEPDVILRDLIKIFHPELDTEWELKYYMKLK
jgi:iron complex transport system substrate-binding protein